MDFWSNIETSPDDREIVSINRMEQALGHIPEEVYEVRTLITRFEVCHFKYQTHYRHIIQSIADLKSHVDIGRIGETHPRNGEAAVEHDVTGRSRIAQRYINALKLWQADGLGGDTQSETSRRVAAWLGKRDAAKNKLVSMLLDRLLYRLDGYGGGEMTELEYQVLKTDICCYGFPETMETILQAIGKLTPVENFDGCGTVNDEIKRFAGERLKELCQWLHEDGTDNAAILGGKTPARAWLAACLAKTIKAQIQATDPIPFSQGRRNESETFI